MIDAASALEVLRDGEIQLVGPAIVWVAHADNIDRLLHGAERKFDFAMLRGSR